MLFLSRQTGRLMIMIGWTDYWMARGWVDRVAKLFSLGKRFMSMS